MGETGLSDGDGIIAAFAAIALGVFVGVPLLIRLVVKTFKLDI